MLGRSYDSSNGIDSDQAFDFTDLPLTPPDSGASGFQLGVSSEPPQRSRQDPVLVSDATPPPVLLPHDQIKSPPRVSSKNDIFNSPITWVTPPSRLNQLPPSSTPISPAPPSRNSLFFSSSVPPRPFHHRLLRHAPLHLHPSPARAPTTQAGPPSIPAATTSESQQSAGRKKGTRATRRSAVPALRSVLQEEARIRAAKHVDFRLCPTNEFLLGEGRHCSVYLGSYRPRKDVSTSSVMELLRQQRGGSVPSSDFMRIARANCLGSRKPLPCDVSVRIPTSSNSSTFVMKSNSYRPRCKRHKHRPVCKTRAQKSVQQD